MVRRAAVVGLALAIGGCTAGRDDGSDDTDVADTDTDGDTDTDRDTDRDRDTDGSGSDTDAPDTDVDTDPPPIWTLAGVPADPLDVTLPPWLDRPDLPLHDVVVDTLAETRDRLGTALQRIDDARTAMGTAACGTGHVAWRGGSWFPSVVGAMLDATDDDVVLVCPGTFQGIVPVTGALVVAPAVAGSRPTLWQPGNPVVLGELASSVSVVGMALGTDRAGTSRVWVGLGGDLLLADVHIVGGLGPQLVVDSARRVDLVGNVFTDNVGGTSTQAMFSFEASTVVAWGNRLSGNTSQGASVGLDVHPVQGTTARVVVARNTVEGSSGHLGGALFVTGGASDVQLATLGNRWADLLVATSGGTMVTRVGRGTWLSLGDASIGNRAAGATFAATACSPGGLSTTIVAPGILDDVGVTGISTFLSSGSGATAQPCVTHVDGGTFARNDHVRAVVSVDAGGRATGVDSAFGTGVDANEGEDVEGCGRLGPVASWAAEPGACTFVP